MDLAAAFIAFLIFLPNLLWERANHWPTIEILQNVDRIKNAHQVPWAQFVVQQAFLVHPLGAPICIAGLWFFSAQPRRKGLSLSGLDVLFSSPSS